MSEKLFMIGNAHIDPVWQWRVPQGLALIKSTYCAVSIDADNVIIRSMKPAEDGDGYIVRAFETAGKAVSVTIDLPLLACRIKADFAPLEVKTFRIVGDTVSECLITEY